MFLREPEFDEGVIIDEPDLMTKSRRLTEWSITVVSWALWFVILRPVLVLILWALGIRALYVHMLNLGGFSNPGFFVRGGVYVGIICITILAWTLYDRIRYARRYKGLSRGLAVNRYMGAFFRMSDQDVRSIKQGKRLDVYFEKDQVINFVVDGQENRIAGFFAPQRMDLHSEEVRQLGENHSVRE